jgi:hypothetical protein
MHCMTLEPGSDAVSNFVHEYAGMVDGELMNVAREYNSLVGPAQEALRAEFERRRMKPPLVEDDDGDEVVDSERLVTVGRYMDVPHAIVQRSVLESAGIFCFLQDENFVRVDWGAGIALGGVRLQVRPEDVKDAEDLLKQPMPEAIEYEGTETFLQPHCPRCGSTDVAFPAVYAQSLAAPAGDETWRCGACGCQWCDDGKDVGAGADGQEER